MLKSDRQHKSSPLLQNEIVRVCGWLRSTAPAPKPVYRRPYRRRLSRKTLYTSPVATVAQEAAWGGVNYASLIEGMPRYAERQP